MSARINVNAFVFSMTSRLRLGLGLRALRRRSGQNNGALKERQRSSALSNAFSVTAVKNGIRVRVDVDDLFEGAAQR